MQRTNSTYKISGRNERARKKTKPGRPLCLWRNGAYFCASLNCRGCRLEKQRIGGICGSPAARYKTASALLGKAWF